MTNFRDLSGDIETRANAIRVADRGFRVDFRGGFHSAMGIGLGGPECSCSCLETRSKAVVTVEIIIASRESGGCRTACVSSVKGHWEEAW